MTLRTIACLDSGAVPPCWCTRPGGWSLRRLEGLLCAVDDTDECEGDGACLDGDADDVSLPSFVRIDVGGKKIQILDDGREGDATAIQSVTRTENRVILQGVEAGRGWSLVIALESGETTMSVSDDGYALLAFGSCTAL